MMTSKSPVGTMDDAFNGQILVEKLSKINKSEQSVSTLSHWCIDHKENAKQVVETWDKFFNSSRRKQRVPLLYLANDIIQKGRRKENRFVNRFWKVLPRALKDVYENGDDGAKKAVTKLVDIWEERKVFGSHGKRLRDKMLGKDHPPLFEINGESSQSQSIKIVKKDAHSIRIKLAIGDMPEKIVTAFQSVYDEHLEEDAALRKCKEAAHHIGKVERDVNDASTHGNQQGLILANELQEQKAILGKCIKQLGSVEAKRATVVAKLKEAIQEQETKLELVRTQLQVAEAQVQQTICIEQRLSSGPVSSPRSTTMISTTEAATAAEPSPPPRQVIHTPQPPPLPVTSFTNSKTTTDEERKRTAAAIAAQLTASTSGAQILTKAMAYVAAKEAASTYCGLNTSSFANSFPDHLTGKKRKIENPMPIPNISSGYFGPVQQQQQLGSLYFTPVQASGASMQFRSQTNQQQPPFAPSPTLPPMLQPAQQYVQSRVSAGAWAGVGAVPYVYGDNGLPPPLPNHTMGWVPQPQPKQQHSVPPGYYQSPTIGFYW